jgi:hypothetical protein
MVTIQNVIKQPLHEVFPLTYEFIRKETMPVYNEEDIQIRLKSIALPILLALEHHFEELNHE